MMIRKTFLFPVAALFFTAACLSSASAADSSYGNDRSVTTTTTTSSRSASSSVDNSVYNDVSPSSGGYYDWNPFTANEGVYITGQAGGSFTTGNDLDDGGSYAVAVGYQFSPMIRAELEGAYRNNDFDNGPGDADTWTAMLNAFWDFKNDTRFTPYIMGGLGWAFQSVDSGPIDDDDNAFVYQVGAGASYNMNQNWALTADYRWVDTAEFDYGGGASDDYSAHEIRAGVRYTF